MGHQAERAKGSDGPNHKGLSDSIGGSLVATLLGEEHSKIKPRVDNAPEAVVKASRIRK
jgi:hypothetical protein